MGSTLLTLGKEYQKEHKWEKAIECYEKFMAENNEKCEDKIYVLFAKCLRVVGRTSYAEELLMKGREQHPQSVRIIQELHSLYDLLGDWDSAKATAKTLIEMNPKESNYHFQLGRIYSFRNEYKKAKHVHKTGLKYKHGMSLEELIERIQRGFADNPADVSSKYISITGRNNLGAFVHKYKDKKYFTKISRNSRDARREVDFYKDICEKFPLLRSIVPLYIDSKVIDKVIYLTMEMIEDTSIASKHINEIIETSQKISSIRYHDLNKDYPNPRYLFQLRNRAISVVIFFTKIHKEDYNQRLFSSLYRLIKQTNYPKAAYQIIRRLESLVMKNSLYMFINPEKHYSLLQGDFIPQNIKIEKQEGTPKVFDWGTFTVGPHFIDIARYLSASFIPYSRIKEIYLFNDQMDNKLSLIERIFFLYALILLYLLTSGNKGGVQTRLTEYISPALKDLEVLVEKFKEDQYNHAIQLLVEEREKKRVKVKKLEKESNRYQKKILKLERESERYQKLFNDVLNSKSWKVTAPLRNITKRIKGTKTR